MTIINLTQHLATPAQIGAEDCKQYPSRRGDKRDYADGHVEVAA